MAYSWKMKYIVAVSAIALYSTVSVVAAEEDSDCSGKENCINKSTVILPVKIGAIASIIVGITIGVCCAFLGRTFTSHRPDRNTFFFIRDFFAGIFLATALVQVLHDAFEYPTNESSS
jgi:zinc transporter 1/2/3